MLGALSSGAVLAKGLIGGKQHSSLKPVDIALTVVVGGGMMVILTAVMQELNLLGTTPSKVLLVFSMFLCCWGRWRFGPGSEVEYTSPNCPS